MKKALRTFRNMEQYIVNSFDYEYSNGITEGINNLIKQIKHAACGYKKFKPELCLLKVYLIQLRHNKRRSIFDLLIKFIYR